MSSTQEVGEIFGAGSGPAHAMLRSPTVLIASIGLWGMNVYFFRVFGIDYVKVLNHDLLKLEDHHENINKSDQSNNPHASSGSRRNSLPGGGVPGRSKSSGSIDTCVVYAAAEQEIDDEEVAIMGDVSKNNEHDAIGDEITAGRLVVLSLTLLFLLHATYSIWIDWLDGGSIGAIFAFYGAVTIAMLLPLQSARWLRHAAYVVLYRACELFNPRCHCLSCCPTEGPDGPRIPRLIPFVDVFFADAMCSLSKVFFDWGMLLHMASYYPKPVPASAWNIVLPSAFAAVPFFVRARQCLVMWRVTSLKNDPGRYQHLWNALKYSTSIFPLCLSAYQKTVMRERAHELEHYLIFLLAINATYALWWDIGMFWIETCCSFLGALLMLLTFQLLCSLSRCAVMDWGMMKNPSVAATVICNPASSMNNPNLQSNGNSPYLPVPTREHLHASPVIRTPSSAAKGSAGSSSHHHSCWYLLLRNRLRFGVGISVLILLTDVILRFSWVLRFYHRLFPSGDSFVLCTQFLEVFRRAIWNLLRVEWENLKQSGHHLPTKPTSSPVMTSSIQMIPIGGPGSSEEEKASFLLNQRGGHGGGGEHKAK